MAFSLAQSPSNGIAAAATSSALTVSNPSLGQLLIAACGIYSTGTAPVISVTDNGSAGWTLLRSSIDQGGGSLYVYLWYKEATSTDVSSLTTVTFSWTNGSSILGGSCSMDEYDGFVGTPTLDLNPVTGEGSGLTSSTISGSVPAQATELALGVVFTKASPGATTGTNTYSPNNGTNTYTWTSTHSTAGGNSATLIRAWAPPTAAPATASKFIQTWTSGNIAAYFGATFYDPGVAAPTSGFMAFMPPPTGGAAPGGAQAILAAGGGSSFYTPLTQADINTMALWGVGGLVLPTAGNGQNFSFDSSTDQFSGSPGSSDPGSGQPYHAQWVYRTIAGWCHAAGMKVYATLQPFNYYQSASNTGFYGPLLGNMNPSYTDPNGSSWTDWYQMCADLGDAMVWMGFDGVYFNNENVSVNNGTGETTWCAGYWANSFGASTTVAQERTWAQAAGASVMQNVNGGRSGANANNYPVLSYCSSSSGRLGNFPGGVFSEYYDKLSLTTTIDYQGSKILAVDTAMIDYSSFLWFWKGLASETTAPVVFGDPAFYTVDWITTSSYGLPWYSSVSATQCWENAIAYDVAGFAALANGTTIAGFTLPSNCYITPFIWPLDQTPYGGGGGSVTWLQSDWNSAQPAILAGAQAGVYLIFQFSQPTYGTALGMDYTNNTYVRPPYPATTGTATSGGGANYTPLEV